MVVRSGLWGFCVAVVALSMCVSGCGENAPRPESAGHASDRDAGNSAGEREPPGYQPVAALVQRACAAGPPARLPEALNGAVPDYRPDDRQGVSCQWRADTPGRRALIVAYSFGDLNDWKKLMVGRTEESRIAGRRAILGHLENACGVLVDVHGVTLGVDITGVGDSRCVHAPALAAELLERSR